MRECCDVEEKGEARRPPRSLALLLALPHSCFFLSCLTAQHCSSLVASSSLSNFYITQIHTPLLFVRHLHLLTGKPSPAASTLFFSSSFSSLFSPSLLSLSFTYTHISLKSYYLTKASHHHHPLSPPSYKTPHYIYPVANRKRKVKLIYVKIWKPKFMIHNMAISHAISSGFNWTNCMTSNAKGFGKM